MSRPEIPSLGIHFFDTVIYSWAILFLVSYYVPRTKTCFKMENQDPPQPLPLEISQVTWRDKPHKRAKHKKRDTITLIFKGTPPPPPHCLFSYSPTALLT